MHPSAELQGASNAVWCFACAAAELRGAEGHGTTSEKISKSIAQWTRCQKDLFLCHRNPGKQRLIPLPLDRCRSVGEHLEKIDNPCIHMRH